MNAFTGTPTLTRAALRREWLRLTLWIVGLALLMMLMAAAVRGVFETDEGVRPFVELYVANPVMRMFGLASGATLGAFVLTRGYIIIAVLVALFNIFTVIRNTRANEDLGRTELIGSLAVGRHAGLATALILTAGANLTLGLLIVPALLINGLGPIGSIAAGASVAALGMAFACVAAVTAQIAENARKANGMAAMVMGVMALLSSIGNVIGRIDEAALRIEPAWPAWLSPFGWGQLMRPFDTNQWAFLLLFVLFFMATIALALALESRRDVGQGILPQRRGPPVAPRSLQSSTGLAWRQQRGVFFGWTFALIAIGLVYAVTSTEIENLLEGMEDMRELFEQLGGTDVILDGYFSTVTGILGLLTTIYVIQTLLRTRHEEIHGPLEGLLATATSRTRWLTAHTLNAALGALTILLLVGLTIGITAGFILDDLRQWTIDLTRATLVRFPAVLVFAGITILAFGAFPRRATLITWGAFMIALIAGPMFGPLLDLPQWVMDISPFTHVAGPPAQEINTLPLVVLFAVAVALWVLGILLFRRRDLEIH